MAIMGKFLPGHLTWEALILKILDYLVLRLVGLAFSSVKVHLASISAHYATAECTQLRLSAVQTIKGLLLAWVSFCFSSCS